MANDPVLQRSMFQKQAPTVPSVAPSVGLGIGSVTTPDQNAQAMRSLFQPTVSMSMPMQEPVQSFQEGGLATPLVAQYNFRNRQYQNPPSYAARTDPAQFEADRPAREAAAEAERLRAEARLEEQRARYAPEQARYRAMEEARRAGILATERARSFDIDDAEARSLTPDARRRLEGGDRIEMGTDTSVRGFTPGGPGLPQSGARQRALEELRQYPDYEGEIRSRYLDEVRTGQRATPLVVPLPPRRPDNLDITETPSNPPAQESPPASPPPATAAVAEAPARQKGTVELTLEGIKAERAAERRENALLALMQAGFAMAAGRSPNALSNIGAGGQAGIGAFAAMERASREDAAARRREAIQLDLANRQLEKDPETVKLFKSLGGGDLMKGFEIYNSDKKLQAATTIAKDITAPEEDRRAAAEYIRGQLMKARGGGSYSGFSATPVK